MSVLGLSAPVGGYVLSTREDADIRRLGGNAIWASIVAGALAAGLIWILEAVTHMLPANLAAVPGLLAAVFLATARLYVQRPSARSRPRGGAGARRCIPVVRGVPAAGIGYLALGLLGGGLTGAVWIVTAAPFLAVAIAGAARPRLGALAVGRPDQAILRRTVRNGLRFYPGEIAALLHLRVDIVLLGLLAPVAFAGVYVVAYQTAEPILVIASAAQASLLALGRDTGPADASPAARLTRETIVLATGLALAAGVVAPWLIPIVYGPAFAGAVGPFIVLLPAVVALAIGRIAIAELTRANRLELTVVVSAAALVVNLGLNLALIPPLGALGAALASLGSYSLLCAMALFFVARVTTTRGREFVPGPADVRAVVDGWTALRHRSRRGRRPGDPSSAA